MQYSNIPQELRGHKAWLVWKYLPSGKGKPIKMPMYANGRVRRGQQGTQQDRDNLVTFDEALAAVARHKAEGLGFAVLPDWGIVALDFDECVKNKVVDPVVEALVSGTYAEISPSGKGIRAFMLGALPNKKSRANEKQWGFETFGTAGFVTITGNTLDICDLLGTTDRLEPLTDGIKTLYEQRFNVKAVAPANTTADIDDEDPFATYEPKVGLSLDELKTYLSELDPSAGQDEGWLQAGMALHHETDGSDEGFELWNEWSSGGHQYPGAEGLAPRWASFGKRRSGRPITARWLIKNANAKKAGETPVLDAMDYMDMARKFIAAHFETEDGVALLRARGLWYENTGPCYVEKQDDFVVAMLWRWLQKSMKHGKNADGDPDVVPFKPNKSKVDNAVAALRATTLVERANPPCWLDGYQGVDPSEIVSLANGLLHIPTRELMPHSPGLFNVNALPYDWCEAGEPVLWLRFLREVWEDDEESIQTLQEMFGYLITADTSQQKMFFIKGPKRSGKGTIGRILNALIGAENVVSPQFSSITDRFGLEPLIDKLVAVMPDVRIDHDGRAQVAVERLLMISGEDNVTVDRKNISAWTGRMTARIVMLSNLIPTLRDTSGALAGRLVVLAMRKSFYGKEDTGLGKRLLTELPQILKWALDGKDRLKERGYFIQPRSALDVVEEVEDAGNPIKGFLRERCEIVAGCSVLKREMYEEYEHWCHGNGQYKVMALNNFGKALRDADSHITTSRPAVNNPERLEYYEGIRIRQRVEESLV